MGCPVGVGGAAGDVGDDDTVAAALGDGVELAVVESATSDWAVGVPSVPLQPVPARRTATADTTTRAQRFTILEA